MKNNEFWLFVLGMISIVSGWYFFYVQPRDVSLGLIRDCMIEINDLSENGYQYCVKVANEK